MLRLILHILNQVIRLKNKEKNPAISIKYIKRLLPRVLNKTIDWIGHFQHVFWIICIVVSLTLLTNLMPEYIWEKIYLSLIAKRKLVYLGLIFCLTALSLVWSFGQKIDAIVFKFLNRNARKIRWLDMTMLFLTQLGNFIFALLTAIVLSLSGHRLLAYELIIGLLSLGLAVQCLKVLIHRPRPYTTLKGMNVVGPRNGGHSFPSGHTSQAFFMVSLLLQYFKVNTFVWLALYGVALLVGLTRIFVGMHYPRDVIAGAILGTGWGIMWVTINIYIFSYLNIY